MTDSLLELKINTRNIVNAKANYVRKYMQDMLRDQFMNKKIVKFTPYKSFTAQVSKQLDELQQRLSEQKFRLVFNFSMYRICATIDMTYRDSDVSVAYVKQEFYVATIDDKTGVLTEIADCDDFRSDYTVQEIINKRTKIAELDRQLSALKSEMNRFEKGY